MIVFNQCFCCDIASEFSKILSALNSAGHQSIITQGIVSLKVWFENDFLYTLTTTRQLAFALMSEYIVLNVEDHHRAT